MQTVLNEIITLITGGLTGIASGIGSGLQDLVKAIFVTGTGTSSDPYALSVFGSVIITFAGVSLAFGMCRWVLNFCTSLGNRNR